MRARPDAHAPSLPEARALLGLSGPFDRASAVVAFRTAIKTARPDLPGGDAERFRSLIEAYRLVLAAGDGSPSWSLPRTQPLFVQQAVEPVLTVDARQALAGAALRLDIDGRRLRIRVPAGMRSGERLRLRRAGPDATDLFVPVLIRPADDLSALGDDLYMTVAVSPRLLDDGGRLEIETHAGPRSVWIVGGQGFPRLRLKDLGLPARGSRPQGHLFVTLKASEDAPSPAEDMLSRFTRVWTPDRMAA